MAQCILFHFTVDELELRAVMFAPPTQVLGVAPEVEVLASSSEFEH